MEAGTFILLLLAGLGAGFIDAIAGGGGLISMPALMWAGLPPHLALGTNKMQSSFGTAAAVMRYSSAGLISWKQVRLAALVTFAFAGVGALTVTQISNTSLQMVVPWMLLAVALYTLLSPRLGIHSGHARLNPVSFSLLAGSALGFYDGFFGPGTGSFWTLACIGLFGLELTRATAFTKVVNLASNLASLLIFILASQVRYDMAVVMIVGQITGARMGSSLVIRHGAPLVRIVFLIVIFVMIIKLLSDQL
jgi:uncharacterized membrane protein YfcA